MASPPTCPICRAVDDRSPDTFGVHACRGCGVEFRPPGRVPVRSATISSSKAAADSKVPWGAITIAAIVIGAIVGVVNAPSQPSQPFYGLPPPTVEIPEIPVFDPTLIDVGPTKVPLEHEVQRATLVGTDQTQLQATGLVRNPLPEQLDRASVEVLLFNRAGDVLSGHEAVIACSSMGAHDTCAWAIDVSAAAPIDHFEFFAFGEQRLIPRLLLIDARARFDARGQRQGPDNQLDFDVERGMVSYTPTTLTSTLDMSASVTVFDADGQVLDVVATAWRDVVLEPGTQSRALPLPPHEAASYEVRVHGVSWP